MHLIKKIYLDYTVAGGDLDMADLYVRNLDNTAIKKLDESAKKIEEANYTKMKWKKEPDREGRNLLL